MLGLLQFEELEGLLLEVPALARLYEDRDPQFRDVGKDWLERLSNALRHNRLSLASRVVVLRSDVTALERRRRPPVAEETRPPIPRARRSERDAVLLAALKEATELVHKEVGEPRARFADAELLARRILALAEHKGLLPADAARAEHPFPEELYRSMQWDADLVGGVIQLNSLVGLQDALIILDRRLVDVG